MPDDLTPILWVLTLAVCSAGMWAFHRMQREWLVLLRGYLERRVGAPLPDLHEDDRPVSAMRFPKGDTPAQFEYRDGD